MDCQEFEELSGAYALDAITWAERQVANVHLAQCPKCQNTLRELRAVTSFLPLSVPVKEPSPQLKERLFAAIRAEPPRQVDPKAIQQQPRPRPFRQRTERWLMMAAAVLLFALLSGMTAWNISLQQQVATLSPVTYTIRGTAEAAGASGQAVYLPQLRMTVVTVQGLPSLVGTQVYQGWLITNKQPKSIGTLNVENGMATLNFPGDVRNYDMVAISREPGPQASRAAPNGPVVAIGQLPHTS